ncbi:MAG: hypothetical protein V3V08_22570 [Nannocystaceae bacterium]
MGLRRGFTLVVSGIGVGLKPDHYRGDGMEVEQCASGLPARRRQRGATMVSVMLLTASMLTVAVLTVRSSTRQLVASSAVVSRERALMVAQAGVDLATGRIRAVLRADATVLDTLLSGNSDNVQQSASACDDATLDCIPGEAGTPATGQRNEILTDHSSCSGRPCMRPGAVLRLPNAEGTTVYWADIPIADLLDGADAEARITVWLRNNVADAIGDGSGSWTEDSDSRVIVTSMASLRNATVTIEQEMLIASSRGGGVWSMDTPDEGYGGGHNNDSTSVEVCRANYVGVSGE